MDVKPLCGGLRSINPSETASAAPPQGPVKCLLAILIQPPPHQSFYRGERRRSGAAPPLPDAMPDFSERVRLPKFHFGHLSNSNSWRCFVDEYTYRAAPYLELERSQGDGVSHLGRERTRGPFK